MMLLSFSLAILAAAVSGQGTKDLGQITCPCTNDNSAMPVGHPLKNSDYGTHCHAWDDTRPWCDPESDEWEEGNEAWCKEEWCYVDRDDCIALLGQAEFGARYTSVFEKHNVDLWYSYETCGSKDYYRKDAWEIEIEWAEVCECTGDNSLNPLIADTDHGESCKAWNKNDESCDKDHETFRKGNELWCPNEWCYVQKGCLAEYKGRNYTAIRSVYDSGAEMFWSYETCGDANFFVGSWNYELTACQARSPADVYLLIDSSGSMNKEWEFVQEGMSIMAGLFNRTLGDRVSLTLFGGSNDGNYENDHEVRVPLTDDIDKVVKNASKMKLIKVPGSTPQTHTFDAIDYIMKVMESDPPSPNSNQEKILVIVTDGRPRPFASQNPCKAPEDMGDNPKWYDVVPKLDSMGVKRLLVQVRRQINELDCLLEKDEDKTLIRNPQFFFDDLTEDFFCVSTIPTDLPTPMPTFDPTFSPTEEPTPEPTEDPTPSPTAPPTEEPTPSPTFAPTSPPTEEPTNDPTLEPSPAPSPEPTEMPTCLPIECGKGTRYDEVEKKCLVKTIIDCDEGTYYDKDTMTCKPSGCTQVTCGEGTYMGGEKEDTCMREKLDESFACGLTQTRLTKGKKIGASSQVDDSCICMIYCAGAEPDAVAFSYEAENKSCTCYTGSKIKFQKGSSVGGWVLRED